MLSSRTDMAQDSVGRLKWMSKFLLAYLLAEMFGLGVLGLALRLSARTLLIPFLLLLLPAFLFGLITYGAAKYSEHPKSYSTRLSLALLVFLLSFLLVLSYFGVRLRLFTPDSRLEILLIGTTGAILSSATLFYTLYRRPTSKNRL